MDGKIREEIIMNRGNQLVSMLRWDKRILLFYAEDSRDSWNGPTFYEAV